GLEERLAQRAQVEAGAPDEQGRAPARFNLFNRAQRVARPIGGSVANVGRDEIDQVVRHAAPFLERDFGRGYLYLAVDLHGVAVDYLAAHAQRERDSEVALARGRRPDDGDNRPFGLDA